MRVLQIVVLLLAACAGSASAVVDTVRFDIADLIIDVSRRQVEYKNLDNISDDGRPGTPVLARLYTANHAVPSSEPGCRVLSADTIALPFHPAVSPTDWITAETVYPVPRRAPLPGTDSRYPSRHFQVYRYTSNGRMFWNISLHPVQYLEGDRIVFNNAVEIIVPADDAITAEPGAVMNILERPRANPSLDDDPCGCPLRHEYILVTSPGLADAFAPLLTLKRRTGYDAAMALTDSIYARYGGSDDAEALRNYLADCYLSGTAYVLLGGDEDHVPVRYAYYYETDTVPSLDYLMMCDLYFADYDGQWEIDGDGVYGEPVSDAPDIGPEVMLGRLPFGESEQVETYVNNLKTYLFDPGGGDRSYLNRSVFLCSDQMRDFFEGGQQYVVADQFPSSFAADCERLAEAPDGVNPSPTGPTPQDVIDGLLDGYGMINILAHGRPDGFVLMSSDYNLNPKIMLLTPDSISGHMSFSDIPAIPKPSFYYSIACSQAAYDLETLYGIQELSVAERLLSTNGSGAVGLVAFTRWGWVGSSYKLMQSFYEHLFSDADGYPVAAMRLSHLDHPYYRDQIYGQNFFGDPSVRVYLGLPRQVQLHVDGDLHYNQGEDFVLSLVLDDQPLNGHPVTVSYGDRKYETVFSDADGTVIIPIDKKEMDPITATACLPGAVAAAVTVCPSITADADDDNDPIPAVFTLRQNHPNPFNPTTTIDFTLTRRQQVTLEIFDILGRLIARPVDDILDAGEHETEWNGTDRYGNDIASGVYLYRIVAEEGVACRKMLLLK